MAHDDELELTYGDFSRYPGGPGIDLDPPLPAYSEEEDDAVTLAMRPLEEQLAEPGPELAWMRAPAPAVALQAPVVASPPAVVRSAAVQSGAAVPLPAPPVARAPSVRPPAAPAAFVPPQAFAAPAFVPPAAASRPPPFNGYEPAPSPPAPDFRAQSVPSLPAPVARAVVPASPRPAAVRPNVVASQGRELAQTRSVRRPPPRKGNVLLLAFATAVFALVAMLGTGAVLYRIGAFQPGSASAAH